MNVKCEDTGVVVDRELAFKGKNGKYYSTETAYKKCMEERLYRQKSADELIKVLGYEGEEQIPSMLFKVIQNCKGYGYKKLYETICKESYSILKAIATKNFLSNYNKFKYIEAIIRNHLDDKSKPDMTEDAELNNPAQKTKDISNIIGGEDE